MATSALGTILSVSSLVAEASAQGGAVRSNVSDSAQVILQRYAEAWRGRQELEFQGTLVLGFWVRGEQGGEYTVAVSDAPGSVVRPGAPSQYDIGFELDIDFLRRLDRGEIGALTAMGQARSSDPIPLNPKMGPQFGKRPDAPLLFRRLSFHFWNRGWPEVIPFSESAAREVHGGNAAVFVYDHRFRSAWYQLKPGMHINANARDQTNNFPQLIIVTRGQLSARLDGRELTLPEGQAIFIPAGMAHEFWAEAGQYAELVWTAFGEGA
jgi:mannose-6-phosphate isomerase-like protein (cupin superfamily)